MEEQEYLREQVKRIKWQEGVTYKTIAENLLNMNYHSFMNFVHGYKELGYERRKILKDYICNML